MNHLENLKTELDNARSGFLYKIEEIRNRYFIDGRGLDMIICNSDESEHCIQFIINIDYLSEVDAATL